MWKPSFCSDYANAGLPTPISGNISLDIAPKCDANLSALEYKKCNLFSKNAFQWWKVKTVLHALSAMKAPVDLACVRYYNL